MTCCVLSIKVMARDIFLTIILTKRKLPRMIHFAYKAVRSGIDHTVNLMAQFAAFVLTARLFFVFIQNEWKQRKVILTINLCWKPFIILCCSCSSGWNRSENWTNDSLYQGVLGVILIHGLKHALCFPLEIKKLNFHLEWRMWQLIGNNKIQFRVMLVWFNMTFSVKFLKIIPL